MTTVNETAYPQLHPEPRPRELSDHYTPTPDELAWARKRAATPLKRVSLLVLLKCAQRLGYFPQLKDIPRPYLDHATRASGFARPLTAEEIRKTDAGGTRQANVDLLRERMDIRSLDDAAWLFAQAQKVAEVQHHVPDIINVLLEELVHFRYELPGFSTLQRVAQSARDKVEEGHYEAISGPLSASIRERIDALFKAAGGSTATAWNSLKQEPAKPTNTAVREYLDHVRQLQVLSVGLPAVDVVSVSKLKHYRALGRALNAAEMAELKPKKRYALAVIFIRSCHARALDDAADLYIRLYDRMQATAQRRLREYQLQRGRIIDALIERFHGTLLAYQTDGGVTKRFQAIAESLGEDAEELAELCEQHLAFANENSLPFLTMGYTSTRSLLFNCLEIIRPRSTSDSRHMERLIDAMLRLRSSRSEFVSLDELGLDSKRDLFWMNNQWRRLVFDVPEEVTQGMVHRRSFELAVHQRIRDDLRNGDLFIERGEKYDDYREQLVDRETFEREVAEYGEVTGIEVDPRALVETLRNQLANRALEVDRGFKKNAHASINDGQLSLKRLEKTEQPAEAEKLDFLIRERLLPISILDVLIDVERWLNLHKYFRHLSGADSRIDDLPRRFVTTLFCYGCNLGAVQTSRSIKGINRRQIGWLNLKYVTEEALDKAIAQVTNAYAKFELPEYWGSGKSASADGTKWDLYEQNMLSEYHIRYGGYGGIGYYHVSDKYIALFSRFIPCGVYEGIHILDGLMENESDIKPDTLHGDTHSQNYAVFAISYLLGIKLMPRIRGIHKLHFFKPSSSTKYRNIEDLFGGAINWRLIASHYNEMLRVVVSIKLGKITASTILRRFGNKNENKLAQAFRELGKVVRTLFLLDYIDTAELRKIISAATNKSEAFNNFIQWAFFGGEGIIQENVAHEQRKLIKYSHLVANMVCLHNVQAMTLAIRQLRAEGMEITTDMLGFLSPYRTWHINRFGDYVLDFNRPGDPMDPDLKIFK